MRQGQNLYEYLHQTLTSQLKSGVYLEGQIFPSQREICSQYNVGITTVRKVMKMLDEQGYIHTAQGQPSFVTYQASREEYAGRLVQRRNEIADAYRGLELLMPVLYYEGAKRCGEPELRVFYHILDGVSDQMELQDHYRLANEFLSTLLRPLHNQLIMDLELDSENYLHVPYIPFSGVENPFATTVARTRIWLKNSIRQIEQKQFNEFYEASVRLYQASGKRVDDYLCALSKYIAAMPQTKECVNWFRTKERSELYARLAMTIIRRMIAGEFDDEKYLPSIPMLMEEYGVMKNTASRAVSLLNSLGFAQTIDKKGSIITPNGTTVFKGGLNLAEPVVQERLSRFMDAFRIVSLTARSCAASIVSVPAGMGLSIERKLQTAPKNKVSPLSFQLLMNCFIQLLPHHSLKNIFQQLDDLLIWGNYMLIVDESLYPSYTNIDEVMGAVVAALKDPYHYDLADAFGNAFSQIYQDACAVISKMPIDFKFSVDR